MFLILLEKGFAQNLPKEKGAVDTLNVVELKELVDGAIDPRKYVTVFYKKRPGQPSQKTLAVWKWSSYSPHQKYRVVDKEGVLNIYFDKEGLSKNTRFKGNISLSASVKGKAGEREIEVSPYSKVGEQQKVFGTNSISPNLTAKLLFNSIYKIKSTLHNDTNLQVNYLEFSSISAQDFVEIDDVLNEISDKSLDSNTLYKNNVLQFDTSRLQKTRQRYKYYDEMAVIEKNWGIKSYTYVHFRKDLNRLRNAINLANEYYLQKDVAALKRKFERMSNDLHTINAYITAFEESGTDAMSIFLQLIGKDIVQYKQLRKSLAINIDKLDEFSKTIRSDNPKISDGSSTDLLKAIISDLLTLSSFTGSEFAECLFGDFEIPQRFEEKSENLEYEMKLSLNEYRNLKDLKVSQSFNEKIDILSKKAGEYLYSQLAYATIDLAKNDVKEGDILYLYVQWKNYKDQMVDSLKSRDEEKLEIGTYSIRTTGWTTDVSESFYLIERINEPARNTTGLSPSNFKGAAGVSLMRSFNYAEPNKSSMQKFCNWLQPSFGLNLSYIDFYTEKDLELGLGLQVGLFKNSIFLGYGLNLNGIRGGESKSTYFALGLSFVNLAAKFKSIVDSD